MLPIQSVLYEMLPRRNVTIRKCTIRNVTDPFFHCFPNLFFILYSKGIFIKQITITPHMAGQSLKTESPFFIPTDLEFKEINLLITY